MTQGMSVREAAAGYVAGLSADAQARALGQDALERLAEMAQRSEVGARFVAAILAAVADEIATSSSGALPAGERATWERVGAVFDDRGAVVSVRARTAIRFADLVSRSVQGDGAFAKLLGVDPSRISQRVKDRSIYAFTGPDGRYFPRWQIARKGKTLPNLKDVLMRMDEDLHPLTVDHWFTTKHSDLLVEDEPASPVEWLATGGDTERVAALAEDV